MLVGFRRWIDFWNVQVLVPIIGYYVVFVNMRKDMQMANGLQAQVRTY